MRAPAAQRAFVTSPPPVTNSLRRIGPPCGPERRSARARALLCGLFAVHGVDARRTIAFALLYFAIFAALTTFDGVAISLFVKRVGADALPRTFGWVALANLVAVGFYFPFAERFSSVRVFVALALGLCASSLASWWTMGDAAAGSGGYQLLYVLKEVFQALFLLHFASFLQRFFTRDQLNQVMPLVYAGGRVGGMAGGLLLSHAGESIGVVNLLVVAAVIAIWVAAGAIALQLHFSPVAAPCDEEPASQIVEKGGRSARELDRRARRSMRGFFEALCRSPLLFWHSVSTIAYIGCRYVLAFQYSTYLETYFASEVELAAFLGAYAQIALGLSLVLQLFVVARLVRWLGLRGTQFGYATLVFAALTLHAVHPTLVVAIFARFVEQELRFAIRNPTNQIVTNFLSRPLRSRLRCWNAGIVTPVATMGTSVALGASATAVWPLTLPLLGLAVGFAYLVTNRFMNLSYTEPALVTKSQAAPPPRMATLRLRPLGMTGPPFGAWPTANDARRRAPLSRTPTLRLHAEPRRKCA